jgi:6-pyruvoyltetrahydropterin/6-carboxytetrahydropterin synthase
MPARQSFRVHVTKDYLKFSAAHFIAYPGFRERLHGHNYRVAIALDGQLGPQGYVVDFGVVKRIARRLCERLDERLLIPEQSDCLEIRTEGDAVPCATSRTRSAFRAPTSCFSPSCTPRSRSGAVPRRRAARELDAEGVGPLDAIEVSVEESFGQRAIFRREG